MRNIDNLKEFIALNAFCVILNSAISMLSIYFLYVALNETWLFGIKLAMIINCVSIVSMVMLGLPCVRNTTSIKNIENILSDNFFKRSASSDNQL